MTAPENPVILVTGGSRGIGAGICQVLLSAGYRVGVGYCKQAAAAEVVAKGHANARVVPIDIGNSKSVIKAFETLEAQWGPVLALVNNAGIAQEKPFLTLTEGDWAHMLNINLVGAVRCIQRALPAMQQAGWGRIVNITSIGGQWGGMNQVHYAAAKAGLINLTRSMAKLYSKDGVTCNAIAPGLIATDMSAAELDTPAGKEKVKNIPAGRLGTAEEVGEAVRYLLSPAAAYITGQTLNLNGGMYFD